MQAIVGHSFNQSSSGQLRSAYIRRAEWPDEREVRRERLVERSDTRTKKWTIQWRVPASDEFRPPKSPAASSGIDQFRRPTSSGLSKVRQRVPKLTSSGVRRVPASQESGSEFRHWPVPASDEFRPLKSPAASSGIDEFRRPTSSGLPKSGSEFRHWRVPASDEFRPPRSPAASSGIHEFRHTTSPTSQESGSQRIWHEFGIPLLMQRWRKFALKSCPATTPLSQVFPTTLQSRATSILVAGQLPVLLWPFLRKGVWRPHLPRNFRSTF